MVSRWFIAQELGDTSLRVRWMDEDAPDEWVRELVSEAGAECIADFWTHERSATTRSTYQSRKPATSRGNRASVGWGDHHHVGGSMSKYLIRASYSPEGMKGVMAKGGTARVDAIKKLAAGAAARWSPATSPSGATTSTPSLTHRATRPWLRSRARSRAPAF
jgi:hypothetical protein